MEYILKNEIKKNMEILTNNLEEIISFIEFNHEIEKGGLEPEYRNVFFIKKTLAEDFKSFMRYSLRGGIKEHKVKWYIDFTNKNSKIVGNLFKIYSDIILNDLTLINGNIDETIELYSSDLFLLSDENNKKYDYYLNQYVLI